MNNNSRIKTLFENNKARIGYLTGGDGGIEKTYRAAMTLIKGGINLLEIGMPFSDPIADGPVIQQAALRALKSHLHIEDVFELAKKIRKQSDVPLILFSYLNPIYQLLEKNKLHLIKSAGFDGLLIVDCPFDECPELVSQCMQLKLSPISIITPSTPKERIKKISKNAKGFIYYACRKGTTGIKNTLPSDLKTQLKIIKSSAAVPVVVGFGISNRSMVNEVLKHADGVVIGSLFVKALENSVDYHRLTILCQKLFGKIKKECSP